MNNAHSANFGKLVNAAKALRTEAPNQQVAKIKDKLVPAIVRQVSLAKGPAKRLYENAHNAFLSIADGIRDDEVSKQDYQQFIAELSDLQAKAVAAEAKAKKKETAGPHPYSHGLSPDDWSANENKDQMRQAFREDDYIGNAKRVMQKYKSFESMVPRSIPKRFKATLLPITVVTNPGLSHDKLKETRLLADVFMGYPILAKQVMLGLNSDWVVSEYKRDTDEAVKDVLEILEQETGKKYFALGEPKKRGQVDWVWLATENDMRRLNKSSFSGHFTLKGWSFPFESDESIKKPAPTKE